MTIEELLDLPATGLKAMTDAELLEHFKPMLNVTRPELAPRPQTRTPTQELISPEAQQQMKLKIARLKALGIEVDEQALMRKLKKK